MMDGDSEQSTELQSQRRLACSERADDHDPAHDPTTLHLRPMQGHRRTTLLRVTGELGIQSAGSSAKQGGARFDLRLDAHGLSARLSERLEARALPNEDEAFSTFLLAAGLYQIFE